MFSLISSVCSSASNIINRNNGDGPGGIKEKLYYLIENARAASDSIVKQNIVYLHDGVYYIKGENKGQFSLTGYCACTKCGTGTGITASGKPVRENHTIASDWKVLPKGTTIILENAIGKDGTSYDGVYVVEDKGGGVKNNHIDIYRPSHDLASLVTYYGKAFGNVYIAIPIATIESLGGENG